MQLFISPEVERRISNLLATGRFADENEVILAALHCFEDATSELEEDEAHDLAAIQRSLDAVRAGVPGVSLDEAFAYAHKTVEDELKSIPESTGV